MRIELSKILEIFPQRIQDSHKGTYGKIINIAGSKFYSGAAILSSISALKTGAGYVTLACPENICDIVASYSPDITLFPLNNTNGCISLENIKLLLKKVENYDVVSIGSGLSQNTETQKFIIEFLGTINQPCIIDADAINAISRETEIKIPEQTVITPHPQELSRLINISVTEIQSNREHFAIQTAEKFNCTVVLKGHETIVTDGKRIYINKTGNSALAKAGTGDVLTGIISGLKAQMKDKDLFYAASLGVYLHGKASDIAIEETTEYSLLASELINFIPSAIKNCLKYK